MPCDLTGRVAAEHKPSLAAVGLCAGNPDQLFELAFASMAIAKGSDDRATDPGAIELLETAFVALSELLGFTGEVHR